MTAPPASGRLHGLDALRGLAALAVVIYHITLRYPAFMQGRPTPSTPLFPGFAQIEAGIVPVLWFFLLSGFVITWTVDRSRSPMDFVVSRVSRIYPAYWASLLLAVAVLWLWPLPGTALDLPVILVNVSMLQAWLLVPDVAGVYWSLAIELMFYAYALALFASGRWRRVHLAAFAWSALALGNTLLERRGIATPWRLGQLLLIHYAPFLVAGMSLYQLWRRQHPAWAAVTLAVCTLAIVLAFSPVTTGFCLGAMGLIAGSAYAERRGTGAWPGLLLWLGSISYPLYLVHEYPSYIVMRTLDSHRIPHGAAMAAALALSVALAAMVSYGVERPALRALRAGWRSARNIPVSLSAPKS